MQFGLTSLLIYISALAVVLGLNTPAESLVGDVYVLPCIIVGFHDVPNGYEDRIPSSSIGPAMLRPRLAGELWAKNMDVTRGWPLVILRDRGFFYELDDGNTWFGIPDSPWIPFYRRFSSLAFLVNCLVVLLPAMMVDRTICRVRRRRRAARHVLGAHDHFVANFSKSAAESGSTGKCRLIT